MKLKLALIFVVSLVTLLPACSSPANTNNYSTPTVEKQTYTSIGVIKSIDIDTDRVTVDHEEIPGYMSAMEMTEMASDHELLGSIQVGDKVEFEIERRGSTVIYTKFKKIGTVAVVNGGEIYKMNCAECHGGSGEGAKKGIPLTSGHALDHSEDEHIKQLRDGKGNKMPAFRDKLTPEQIAAVVSFVRNTIQGDIPAEKRKGHHH